MDEIKDKKVTQDEWAQIMNPLTRDLEAVFNSLVDEIGAKLRKAAREGWTQEQLEKEIINLI